MDKGEMAAAGAIEVKPEAVTYPDDNQPLAVIPHNAKATSAALTLDDATKFSDGVALSLATYVSADDGKQWEFVNGCVWVSYGAKGREITTPDGALLTNPDPLISFPSRKGRAIKLVVESMDGARDIKSIAAAAEFVSK